MRNMSTTSCDIAFS